MTSEQTLPVCSHCNDTHAMQLDERQVMCTHCPVPCQRCRHDGNGAYCATTPCGCDCHVKAPRRSAPTPWSPCAGAKVPNVPEGMALEVEGRRGRLRFVARVIRYGRQFGGIDTRYRLIPWPMTPREKLKRLAEALGDGLKVALGPSSVWVQDEGNEPMSMSCERVVALFTDDYKTMRGPGDFNRRALDLLDQLQIGSDDVAAMVGGGEDG